MMCKNIAECLFSGHSIYGIVGMTIIIVMLIICATIGIIECKKIKAQTEIHKEKKSEAEKYILLCPCEKCRFNIPQIKEK